MSSQRPAGWYRDPDDSARERYWDGASWTEHRWPATSRSTHARAGRTPTSRKATVSLVLGTSSLFCLGLLTGIPAMIVGRRASREIDEANGRLRGAGLAAAGFIAGLVGTTLTTLVLVLVVGGVGILGSTFHHDSESTCDSPVMDREAPPSGC